MASKNDGTRSARIVYPVFFAIFPVLSIYSANLSLVPMPSLMRPLLVAVGISLALWGILYLLLRNSARSAILCSALVAATYGFHYIRTWDQFFFIPDIWAVWVWLALAISISTLLACLWRWHRLLNFLSIALIVVTTAQIGFGLARTSRHSSVAAESSGSVAAVGERPDIIYIILDGYGRSDALKRAIGFSNDFFIDGLKQRGFYIAEDSRSNYCQTELSVTSSLNMDFIPNLLPKISTKDDDRGPLEALLDHNAVAKYLKARGYIFAAITSGFPPLRFDSADVNMRSQTGLTLIESALVQMTPIGADRTAVESMYDDRRTHLSKAFDSLESLATPGAAPRFVVAHILAPHPPFVFGPNGEHLVHKGAYGFWDGSDFMDEVGRPEDYRTGYAGQAEYISKRMLQSLDVLLKRPGPKPVILIQGDHGSKLRLDQGFLEHTDVNECFPNLSAFLVPDAVRVKLYPSETPVNSFRILFNGLFGDHFPLKPDRSWYSSFPFPYLFTEVTDRIADHTKMASVLIPRFPPRHPVPH